MTKNSKKKKTPRKLFQRPPSPTLRFSPTVWAKLRFLRDYGATEVGGFGITADDDLLFVEDLQLVEQVCSWAHVAFNDVSVADYFDRQVDAERRPEQFGRVWVHTHPGDCPRPSSIDEETFERVFGSADWAVMFILARGGESYARLRFNTGPRAELEIPVGVEYARPFDGCDFATWEQEYLANVHSERESHQLATTSTQGRFPDFEQALWEEEAWAEFTGTVDNCPGSRAAWNDRDADGLLTAENF